MVSSCKHLVLGAMSSKSLIFNGDKNSIQNQAGSVGIGWVCNSPVCLPADESGHAASDKLHSCVTPQRKGNGIPSLSMLHLENPGMGHH